MSQSSGKRRRPRSARSKATQPVLCRPSQNHRTCKFRHISKRLDLSGLPGSTVLCADCHSKIRNDGVCPIYGCARCKFYVCSPCFERPSCGHGHLLKAISAPKHSVCSQCSFQSKKRRLPMYHCNVCKFKLCLGIKYHALSLFLCHCIHGHDHGVTMLQDVSRIQRAAGTTV